MVKAYDCGYFVDVGDADDDDDDDKYVIKSDEDEEQFACTICRGPFRKAIETVYVWHCWFWLLGYELISNCVCVLVSCGHFFCEACALKHFKKTSRCFNCKKQTNGAFSDRHLWPQISSCSSSACCVSGVFNAAEKLRRKEEQDREEEVQDFNSDNEQQQGNDE